MWKLESRPEASNAMRYASPAIAVVRSLAVLSEARRLLRFNKFFPRLTNWLIARKVKKLYT